MAQEPDSAGKNRTLKNGGCGTQRAGIVSVKEHRQDACATKSPRAAQKITERALSYKAEKASGFAPDCWRAT
jgi:hypothetical protein